MQRPKEVTRIAWLFIGIGSLLALTCTVALLTSPYPDASEAEDSTWPLPDLWIVRLADKVFFEHSRIFLLVMTGLGTLAVIGGISFLFLRRWARFVLEALSYLALAYIAGFLLIWLIGCMSAAASVEVAAADAFLERFGIWGAIIGTLFFLLAGAGLAAVVLIYVPKLLLFPLVRIVGYLRSKALRDAVRRAAVPSPEETG